MLRFPADISPDGRGFAVSFPDIPEALTCGYTLESACEMAADALATAMSFYFEDWRQVPRPSGATPSQYLIDLPASVSVKVLLLNEMLAQGVTHAELAQRMGIHEHEVQRIASLRHATGLDTVEAAFRVLGKRLEITVS